MHTCRTIRAALVLTVVAGLLGCRGAPSEDEPIVPIRNMYDQPRYDPQEESAWFADGRAMRPPVEGAVAREMEVDLTSATGWSDADGSWALTIPRPVVERQGSMETLVRRGRDRYDVFCAACHGYAGAGDGAVARRAGGAMVPPTFHSDRLRHAPDGQIYASITNGIRNMPPYAHSIPLEDRWAIVGYVRALQLSQAQTTTAMNLHAPEGDR